MTDSQIKYQTLMENKRHNLEMESLGAMDSASRIRQASASQSQARTAATRAEGELNIMAMYEPYREVQAIGSAVGNVIKGVSSIAALVS